MLLPYNPEPRDEASCKQWLEAVFARGESSQYDYKDLVHIADEMHRFGVKEASGYSLSYLKAEIQYRAHTFFNRYFRVLMSDPDLMEFCAGTHWISDTIRPYPSVYGNPNFRFELTSLGGTRRLVASINAMTKSREGDEYLLTNSAKGKMRIDFRPIDYAGASFAAHVLYERARQGGSWETSRRNTKEWTEAVYQAFLSGGFEAVWKRLDKVWLDLSASRPMSKSLRPLSLEVRRRLHNGGTVKVFTAKRSLAGVWRHTIRDLGRNIVSIQVEPVKESNTLVTIPADQILELLPCRLECEM